MQFSSDERHAETLAFLRQVRDYIARWPPHPVNRDMLAKIDAHLGEPVHRLAEQAKTLRTGGAYTVVGLCLLQAELHGDELVVRLPDKPSAAPDDMVVAALKNGIEITMGVADRPVREWKGD